MSRTSGISGRDTDYKYAQFTIAVRGKELIDALVPETEAGWLAYVLAKSLRIDSVVLVAGEARAAKTVTEMWKLHLHHDGGDLFYKPGKSV